MHSIKTRAAVGALAFIGAASAATVATGQDSEGLVPKVSSASNFAVYDGSLRQLPVTKPSKRKLRNPREAAGGIAPPTAESSETAPGQGQDEPRAERGPTPAATDSFPGMTQAETGFRPPDTNGDVGPDHYVQTVNSHLSVYDKGTGTRLAGATAINQLWAAASAGGLCQAHNRGDPVVLYDDFADRWLITQFAFDRQDTDMNPATPPDRVAPYAQCAAVSQTADPVNGGWFLYEFPTEDLPANDTTTRFPDYPKWGIWRDGYFFTTNQFGGGGGAGAYAVDRTAMLAGQANPQQIYFDVPGEFSMLPPDADGPIAPPAGDPAPFAEVDDNPDQIQIREFAADFANPANSTFNVTDNVAVDAYDADYCSALATQGNCIPQPGQLSGTGWLAAPNGSHLMFALKYRNFGTHETLVVNHTIDGNGSDVAGVRWYELRHGGGNWAIQQQGTIADGVTHRWIGSVAMDTEGNIGIAYSAGSALANASIRYTHQDAGDPPGTMENEQTLITGSGVQTCTADQDTNGDMVNDYCRNRWGDYSSISVDPVDTCTFWLTNEYVNGGGGWETRIGSFDLCADATTMSVGPSPVNFGNEPVGSTGPPQTVTVTNTGTGNLTVSNVQKLGAHPADFIIANDACTGQQVAPNDTCGIDLRFAPSAPGPRTADLRVSSNASNSPQTVQLVGNGTAPPPPSGTCRGLPVTVGGADGQDNVIEGTPGADVIRGGGGDDVIRGLDGRDVICGQSGDDQLIGGSGSDDVSGSQGTDALRTGTGDDVARGGNRDDTVNAGLGEDILLGEQGPDDLIGRGGEDELRGGGGPAEDRCNGGSSRDIAYGCEAQYLIP